MTRQSCLLLIVMGLTCFLLRVSDCRAVTPFDDCGVLIEGAETGCVIFVSDDYGMYVLNDYGGFDIGAHVRVIGLVDSSCLTGCQQDDGCIDVEMIGECALSGMGPVGGGSRWHMLAAPGPNPAAGVLTFSIRLPRSLAVRARVVDVRGATLATLIDRRVTSGEQTFSFDLRGDRIAIVGSGVHFLCVEAAGRLEARKFVLLR